MTIAGPVTRAKEMRIKEILCMRPNQVFMKCPAKLKYVIKKFEAEGDFSHSGYTHSCPKCRCRANAGTGTWKLPEAHNFYGVPELADCGTYGVGYCLAHVVTSQSGVKKGNWLDKARLQMRSLQGVGMNEALERGRPGELKEMSENAETRVALRGAMSNLQEHLNKLTEMLAAMEGVVQNGGRTDIDKYPILSEYVSGGKGVGSQLSPMSGKTYLSLVDRLSTSIAKVAADQFKVESASMIHRDEVKAMMYQIFVETQKQADAGHLTKADDVTKFWLPAIQGLCMKRVADT